MESSEAIAVIDALLDPEGLNDLQVQILEQVWIGAKYPDIADHLGYDPNYIKDVGSKLWKQLSQVTGEKVSKANLKTVLKRYQAKTNLSLTTLTNSAARASVSDHHWRHQTELAKELANFTGRVQEQQELSQIILDPDILTLSIFGLRGIGKTSLMKAVVSHLEQNFDQIIWRSLKNESSPDSLLQSILRQRHPSAHPNLNVPDLFSHLTTQLETQKYLIILDDFPDDQKFQSLWEFFTQISHQGCVVRLSDEPPHLISHNLAHRSYQVGPLNVEAIQALLSQAGIFSDQASHWITLTEQYGGNPLALQLVTHTIQDYFQGDLADFLREGQIVFQGLSHVLDEQWVSLSDDGKWILFFLAGQRQPTSFRDIKEYRWDQSAKTRLAETIRELEKRSLLNRYQTPSGVRFDLQTAVQEYVTVQLVETISSELMTNTLKFVAICPIKTLSGPAYIQNLQTQKILRPILEKIKRNSHDTLNSFLLNKLSVLQRHPAQDYSAGTLINLLIELGCSLEQQDLSNLTIREVDFSKILLRGSNLENSDLSCASFAYGFGGVTAVSYQPQSHRFISGHMDGRVYLWDGLRTSQRIELKGHQQWIWCCAWTPDGNYAITASEDQYIRVWDGQSGCLIQTLRGHQDRIWQVIALDAQFILSCSGDGGIKLWKISTGQCIRTFQGHRGEVTAIAAINAHEFFSGGQDRTIKRWHRDHETFQAEWVSDCGIGAMVYHSQSQCLYSAGASGVIQVWQQGKLQADGLLNQNGQRIWTLALSPDGKTLAAGGDGNATHLWDLESPKIAKSLNSKGRVWSIGFDFKGTKLIAASDDQAIRVWNWKNQELIETYQSYSNWGCEVSTHPSSHEIAIAHSDGSIYLWNPERDTPNLLGQHPTAVWSITYSPDGSKLVSGGDDAILKIWNIASLSCEESLKGHQSRIWSVDWNPNKPFIASGSSDRTVKIWNANTGDCLRTLEGHRHRIWAVAWHPDGTRLASGSSDRTVKLWDTQSGECLATFQIERNILGLAFDAQGHRLAMGGSHGCLEIWDIQRKRSVQSVQLPCKQIWDVSWSPDETFIGIAGDNANVYLWDTTQESYQVFQGHHGCVWSVAFSQDNQLISSSDDGTTRIWNISAGHSTQLFQPPRIYEKLKISNIQGLTKAQINNLERLGAQS